VHIGKNLHVCVVFTGVISANIEQVMGFIIIYQRIAVWIVSLALPSMPLRLVKIS